MKKWQKILIMADICMGMAVLGGLLGGFRGGSSWNGGVFGEFRGGLPENEGLFRGFSAKSEGEEVKEEAAISAESERIEASFEERKVIALTFDDGPHPRYTPLAVRRIKGTGCKSYLFRNWGECRFFSGNHRKRSLGGTSHRQSYLQPYTADCREPGDLQAGAYKDKSGDRGNNGQPGKLCPPALRFLG